jgi:hypothetical protein
VLSLSSARAKAVSAAVAATSAYHDPSLPLAVHLVPLPRPLPSTYIQSTLTLTLHTPQPLVSQPRRHVRLSNHQHHAPANHLVAALPALVT